MSETGSQLLSIFLSVFISLESLELFWPFLKYPAARRVVADLPWSHRISCGYKINLSKYEECCLEYAYIELSS